MKILQLKELRLDNVIKEVKEYHSVFKSVNDESFIETRVKCYQRV